MTCANALQCIFVGMWLGRDLNLKMEKVDTGTRIWCVRIPSNLSATDSVQKAFMLRKSTFLLASHGSQSLFLL